MQEELPAPPPNLLPSNSSPKTALEVEIEAEEQNLKSLRESFKKFDLQLSPAMFSLSKKYHENSQYQKAAPLLTEIYNTYLWHSKTKEKEFVPMLNLLSLNQLCLAECFTAQVGFQQCLDILGPLNDANESEYAEIYQNMARLHRILGKDKEAADYLQKAFDILLKLHGEDHELVIKVCLLQIYYKERKEMKQDLEKAFACLNKLKELKGEGHSELILPYYVTAELYSYDREIEKVREFCEKAFEISQKYYGLNSIWTLRIYQLLGDLEQWEGNYEKAIENYQKYGEITRKLYTGDHFCFRIWKKGLGICYTKMEKYDLAEENLKEAYLMSIRLFNITNKKAINCSKELGWLYEKQRKFKEALEMYTRCVNSIIMEYGEESPQVLSIYRTLAELYSDLKEYRKAVHLLQYILKVNHKLHGEKSELLVEDLVRLAATYEFLGENVHEIECLKMAIKITKEKYGKEDFELHRLYLKIGIAYRENDQDDKAIRKWKKCLEIRIKEFGPNSKLVIDVSHLLARGYIRKKEDYEAIKLHVKCLKIDEKIAKIREDDTMDSYDDLAHIYDLRKDYVNAQKCLKKAIQVSGQIFKKGSVTKQNLTSILVGVEKDAARSQLYDCKSFS